MDLQSAIRNGDRSTVETLVQNGANINAVYDEETALTFAIENGNKEIALWLISRPDCDINAYNRHHRTPLFCAAKCGHVSLVEILLQKGAAVDQEDLYGDTPLGATAWYDRSDVAEILIHAGANINKQSKKGETPIYRACNNVSGNVVNILLKHGANVNLPTFINKDLTDASPLLASVPSSYNKEVRGKKLSTMIDILKNILHHGANVDARDAQGNTALHLAVKRNEIHAAFILIENNCDTCVSNNRGLTPLGIALQPENQYYQIAFLILLFGFPENDSLLDTSDPNQNWVNLLWKGKDKSLACEAERQMLFRILADETGLQMSTLNKILQEENNQTRNNVNINNNEGMLPNDINDHKFIKSYVSSETPTSLKKLCRRKIRRCLGRNFLSKINKLDSAWSLKSFLVYGLDMRNCHPVQACELQLAITESDVDKLSDVISGGIDVNMSLFVKPPIAIAAENGKEKCAEILLKHGAKPLILDVNGETPLHLASKNGHNRILELLFLKTDDINVKNSSGNTPLHEACSNGMFNSAKIILDHGGDPSLSDKERIYPIHYAAASGDVTLLKCLLDKNASVDVLDRFSNSSLHVACSKGFLYLKENISLPSMFNSEIAMNLSIFKIMYAMDYSIRQVYCEHVNHLECIELLLDSKCDLNVRNDNQKTAYEIAKEFGLSDVIELLDKHKNKI